jgi:hypothetical protein
MSYLIYGVVLRGLLEGRVVRVPLEVLRDREAPRFTIGAAVPRGSEEEMKKEKEEVRH